MRLSDSLFPINSTMSWSTMPGTKQMLNKYFLENKCLQLFQTISLPILSPLPPNLHIYKLIKSLVLDMQYNLKLSFYCFISPPPTERSGNASCIHLYTVQHSGIQELIPTYHLRTCTESVLSVPYLYPRWRGTGR